MTGSIGGTSTPSTITWTPAGVDKDRRRFAFQKAGELWMSDVMHGPAVLVGKQKRNTYLIAFLDDLPGWCPTAFALAESIALQPA